MNEEEVYKKIRIVALGFNKATIDGPWLLRSSVNSIIELLQALIQSKKLDPQNVHYLDFIGQLKDRLAIEVREAEAARDASIKKNAPKVRAVEYQHKIARAIERLKSDIQQYTSR